MQLNLDRLLVFSIGFFFLFTSFNTAQSLAAKVLSDNGFGSFGFYSLGLLYFVNGCSGFLGYPIVKKLGAKTSLIFGAFCYSAYVASFILPAFRNENPQSDSFIYNKKFDMSVIAIGASICGFGAAILWTA